MAEAMEQQGRMTGGDTSLPVLPDTPQGEGSRWGQAHHVMLGFLLLAFGGWLLSGFYRVNAGERAVIERLGEFIKVGSGQEASAELIAPGLHYAMPWPIDTIHRVTMEQVRLMEVTEFNTSPAAYQEEKNKLLRKGADKDLLDSLFDPYVITADKNILHLQLKVQYKVTDPEQFLTRVFLEPAMLQQWEQDKDKEFLTRQYTYRKLAEHVLIREMAIMRVDDALTSGKEELQHRLVQHLNQDLKDQGLGIEIESVQLADVQPPSIVMGAFNDVLVAQQYRETIKKQTDTEVNRQVNEAEAQAQQVLLEAQTYRNKTIADAKADADRFQQLYVQYQAAPYTTRWKLYTEAVNTVMENAKRLYTVQKGQRLILTLPSDDKN